MTCSFQERAEKVRHKAEAKISQNAESSRLSGSKLKAIYSSNSITKASLNQAYDGLTMISYAQRQVKAKLNKKLIKNLGKKIRIKHSKIVLLIKHVKTSKLS